MGFKLHEVNSPAVAAAADWLPKGRLYAQRQRVRAAGPERHLRAAVGDDSRRNPDRRTRGWVAWTAGQLGRDRPRLLIGNLSSRNSRPEPLNRRQRPARGRLDRPASDRLPPWRSGSSAEQAGCRRGEMSVQPVRRRDAVLPHQCGSTDGPDQRGHPPRNSYPVPRRTMAAGSGAQTWTDNSRAPQLEKSERRLDD